MKTEHGMQLLPDTLAAPKRATKKRQLTSGQKVGVAAVGVLSALTGGAMANAAHSRADADAINQAQPACEVTVRNGEGPSAVQARVTEAGDDVMHEHVEAWTVDGSGNAVKRTPQNTPNFMVNGSMGLQRGDKLRIDHVDPAVCIKVGAPIVEASQSQVHGQ